MAVGDLAIAAGLSIVPDSGEEGKVKHGSRELNRTRDYIAQVLSLIPIGRGGYRTAAGISSGVDAPSGGLDGDIYFQIVST